MRAGSVEIRGEDRHSFAVYAAVSIAYEVRATLQAPTLGRAVLPLRARRISSPYLKDYDALPGNHPNDWSARFAVDRAHILAAYLKTRRVGGVVIIVDPHDVARLGGESHLALLWDLRVAPDVRSGIGLALLSAAESDARGAGARGLAVETQDVNFAACQLYARAGYSLTTIQPAGYSDSPGETRLVWTKLFETSAQSG